MLSQGPLVISEFLAINDDVLADEDGQFSDWIEIHNPTASAVSLNGWHLTDDAGEMTKWQFPNMSLPGGDYLVVFASGKDRHVSGDELHTNFQLDGDGEYLALVKADGVTVSYSHVPEYPPQHDNVSYGVTQGVTTFVADAAPAKYLVPSSGNRPTDWNTATFNDSTWTEAVTGIGYNRNPTGFLTTYYKANVTVDSLSVAESVIGNPSQQTIVLTETVDVVNYYNTGGTGRYGGDLSFPGMTIGNDIDDFVVEITATLVIPTAGQWTFGVNSDDGFGLELTNGTDTFSTAHPGPRGPSDTLGVFNISQAGTYDLRLVAYERGGGAGVELFAAEGSYASFNATVFDLVGDTDNGGLAVTGFGGVIRTDVETELRAKNSSLWTRIPFNVDDPTTLDSLRLQMMYNDAFVAYINGTEVARSNFSGTPQWNSSANTPRPYEESALFEDFNVSLSSAVLQAGENVLAIHGLNYNATDDEFLVLPKLIGSETIEVNRFFKSPTPDAPNGDGFVDYVGDTKFSVNRGFYETAFSLEITTATLGATIRYTLDGSNPTPTNGAVYTGPVTIDRTTVLRAAAFRQGYEPTNVDTQTYIFLDDVLTQSPSGSPPSGWPAGPINGQILSYGMDPDIVNDGEWGPLMRESLESLPSMSLVTDLDNLFDSSSGIFVNAGGDGSDWERPTSLELIYPPGATGPGFPDGADAGFQIDAGLRIRGGYSRTGSNPKHAFRFFFRQEYGAGKLNYPLFGNEGTDRFDKIDLRTSQNYSWAFGGPNNNTMVREVFSRDLQGELEQPYTRSRFYHLYINGQYWGIFQTQERSEARYAASYFGGSPDDYDVIKQTDGYEVFATDGTMDAYARLWQATLAGYADDVAYLRAQGLNPDGSPNPAYERLLDVDNLIDYMIITYYTGDRDGPGSRFTAPKVNNYYAVYNRENPDGWKFFEHDSEHSLGTGEENMVTPLLSDRVEREELRYFNAHWLHEQLCANADYARRFADRVSEVFFNDGELTDVNASAKIDARAEQIDMAIIAESARWGDQKSSTPKTHDTWLGNVQAVHNWMAGRTARVVSQLRSVDMYPSIDSPIFNRAGGHVESGFNVTLGATSGTIYYTTDGTDPQMPDGSINPDAEIFQGSTNTTTLISQGATWKYLDNGSNQGTAWRATAFNDNGWASGPAELGYGDGDEQTVLGYGGDKTNKYRTAYFRHEFNATDVSTIDNATVELLRDDGAVVYLNGQELFRSNMKTGPIDYLTPSLTVVGGSSESTFFPYVIDPEKLVEGTNVIAVEVHQTSGTSSDISFDLKLTTSRTITSTPTQLTESTLVKTRARESGEWSALSAAQFIIGVPAGPEGLAITEINYHPADPTAEELATQDPADLDFVGADFEFVELYNMSNDWLELSGVAFVEQPDGIAFDFVGSAVTELAPGQFVLVVKNVEAFEARYGSGQSAIIAGQFTGKLGNGGERLELLGWTGQPIHDFTYNDSGAWPGRADGKGASLEMIDPAAVPLDGLLRTEYLEDGDHWRSSAEYGGSPGVMGEGPRNDILVNEVLAHTDSPDYDSIELVNNTGASIDLGGWYLSDTSADYQKYRIPDGTILGSGQYVVFNERDHFNPTPATPGPNDFALNGAHGDDVWLMQADGSGKLVRLADHVDFPASINGESFGRWPDTSGDLYPMLETRLGAPNFGPRVGPVVISEVMYNPTGPGGGADPDDFEFVEIHNPTIALVDLTNWRLGKGIDFDFDPETTLPAGATLVVVPFDVADLLKLAAFRSYYGIGVGDPVQIVGGYTGRLNDDGEKVQLQHPDEPPQDEPEFIPLLLEDEVIYDDTTPWVTEPDGTGPSLHRAAASLWGNDATSWNSAAATPGSVEFVSPVHVVRRHIFYNESAFDGNGSAVGLQDAAAIATDKDALLPGQTASFANYTSFSQGITGIMVDVAGLDDAAAIGTADFLLRVGNTNDPTTWNAGPIPTVTIRAGEGINGTDRIALTWNAGQIENQWLQVTVRSTGNIEMPWDDVFYFGNAIGESGDSLVHAMVNATDEVQCRNHPHGPFNPAPVDDAYDYNRDRLVNATDQLIARGNQTSPFAALQLISVPSAIAEPPSPPTPPLQSDSTTAAAVDVALTDTPPSGSLSSETLLGSLAWLSEAARTSGHTPTTNHNNHSAQIVDRLLSSYW